MSNIPIPEQTLAARERAGLTQEQLAEAVGCHRSAISRAERAEPAVPSGHVYQAIADALNTPLMLVREFKPRRHRRGLVGGRR